MNDYTETKLSSEDIFKGRVLHVFRDRIRLSNGRESTREYIRHPGAVCLVPLTAEGEILMVRQYRYPFGRMLLEVPAGKLDPGESPRDAALRELSEGDRLIGIISHVSELRREIDRQIVVTRTAGGASRAEIVTESM